VLDFYQNQNTLFFFNFPYSTTFDANSHEHDGVINIFPKQGRDERLKKLLDTNIRHFYFSGIRSGNVAVLKTQYGKSIDVEMNFPNITFRELLDKITKIKRGGWILSNNEFSKPVQKDYLNLDI